MFAPEHNPDGEPFCIVLPPPNVTGVLHMGHALNHLIHDVIIRRKRMQGFKVLWLPGMDHAGIATQNVVERELSHEGLTRHDLGREAFIEQVWEWKRKSGGTITTQMRQLGDSVDWSRERFTMDDGLSAAVREVFVRLYEKDLIYRGNRIINWCPQDHTALSDIEVEYEDTAGELVYINYPFTDGSGHLTVATTRAETMLGDTGVAVHPDDERYADAVGKTVMLPLMNREIPVVADDVVDPEFGTGAVKVTPAHDPNDFEIGNRHDLEAINIFTIEAEVNENGGEFAGLDRLVARTAVKEALAAGGFIDHIEERSHSVGHCYRCKTIVEPYLSLQWFVRVGPLVTPAIDAVREGRTRFVPQRWENSYFHWMENLRDWCVSRQIWWGHRIPAWYCADCDEVVVAREDPTVCPSCSGTNLRQDEDVLDTWFSSALWPFSTLGWPDETPDLATFYPNAVLVTGFDIIYFWVARMLKMGLEFMGEVPFADVVIHGLVRTPGRPQDVQVARQCHRPARRHRIPRRRPAPARHRAGGRSRPGRALRHGVGGGCPQVRQQAVERGPFRAGAHRARQRAGRRWLPGAAPGPNRPGSSPGWRRSSSASTSFPTSTASATPTACSTTSPGPRSSTGTSSCPKLPWPTTLQPSRPARPSGWCFVTCSSCSTRPFPI